MRLKTPKLDNNPALQLFGAGREKRIYAIPSYTRVQPLKFSDRDFSIGSFADTACERCGATGVYLDEVHGDDGIHFFLQ
jgi:alpha-D-ribose 1-methylphosphonate 5-phosphate C-P lyase